jgi:glutamyl/glutaminyl-tRNA synthetase
VQRVAGALETKGLAPSPKLYVHHLPSSWMISLTRCRDQILQGRSLEDYICQILKADCKSYHSAEELIERSKYLFEPIAPEASDCSKADLEKFVQCTLHKHLLNEANVNEALEALFDPTVAEPSVQAEQLASLSLSNLAEWNEESIKSSMQEMQRKALEGRQRQGWQDPELKRQTAAQWYHFLRAHLTNGEAGPAIAAVMAALGKEESMRRLAKGILAELVSSDLNKSLKELDPRILLLWVWIGRPLPAENPVQYML